MRLQAITVSFIVGQEPKVDFTIAPNYGETHPSGQFVLHNGLIDRLKNAAADIQTVIDSTRGT